ncbi:hypothetical protein [Anaeromicrobium sediminis]|uniref:DUF5067 domain-containing protein n=1 Tax=Anaeromicrobium sediminis TaxID=1478221 RepID=A0A267MG92_9FIRM|nr:hypothetical protein [Anaeromicrobium sediminis]PAB58604.1 hypothetical protein CCE28_14060 [Anaeromicrobium sediminis]
MKKILIIILVLIVSATLIFSFNKYSNTQKLSEEIVEENNIVENVDDESYEDEDKINEEFIRVDSQGSVDVAAYFHNLSEDNEEYLIFELMFNTHSVELDNIDFADLSNVKNNNGFTVDEGIIWEKENGSGHHISGYLKVPKKYKEKNMVDESTSSIELEIKGLDEIQSRKFIWDEEALQSLSK